MFILLFVSFCIALREKQYPSANFNTDELVILDRFAYDATQDEIQIGVDVYSNLVSFTDVAIIASSFDMVTVRSNTPEKVDFLNVLRIPIDVVEKPMLSRGSGECEIVCVGDPLPENFMLISRNRMVAFSCCLSFRDLVDGHVFTARLPDEVSSHSKLVLTKMTIVQSFEIFRVTPRFRRYKGFVEIQQPLIEPCTTDVNVYVDVFLQTIDPVSGDSTTIYIQTMLLPPPDQPPVMLADVTLSSEVPRSYVFNISVVTRSGAILWIGGADLLKYLPHSADKPHPLNANHVIPTEAPIIPRAPLIAEIRLENDQIMPLFESSHPAFARLTIVNRDALKWHQIEQITAQINSDYFVATEPEYTFTVWFGVNYYAKFYIRMATGEIFETTLAILKAPQPAYFDVIMPILRSQSGRLLFNVSTNIGEFTIDGADIDEHGVISLARYSPTLQVYDESGDAFLQITMPSEDQLVDLVITAEDVPSSTMTENKEIPEFLQAGALVDSWKNGLTNDQICEGFVAFTFSTERIPFVIHRIDGDYAAATRDDKIAVVIAPIHTRETDVTIVPAPGGMWRDPVKITLKLALFAGAGVDFEPPRIVSVIPFRSDFIKGRIIMSSGVNITNIRGENVDPLSLDQGVYLVTATKYFDSGVECVDRQMITVPPLIPVKLVDVKVTGGSVCPIDVLIDKNVAPFQISIPAKRTESGGFLWREEDGIATPLSDKLGIVVPVRKPGRYQVFFPDSRPPAYSRVFDLADSDFAVADFDFMHYAPRRGEIECGKPIDDPQLVFPARLGKIDVEIVECKPLVRGETCKDVKFDYDEAGVIRFKNVPFVTMLAVEITVEDKCSFRRETRLLPSPDKLPAEISGLEYVPTCDGDETWHPQFFDPYTNSVQRIDPDKFDIDVSIDDDVLTVTVQSSDGCAITRDFEVDSSMRFSPPFFGIKDVNPVFCPNHDDARVVLETAFKGQAVIYHKEGRGERIPLKIPGAVEVANLHHGVHTFVLVTEHVEFALRCRSEVSVKIREKQHFNVEAHIRGLIDDLDTYESTIILVADKHTDGDDSAPEFTRFTADMLLPRDRQYIVDRGTGTDTLRRIPNGHVIKIMIPYPETYSHIRRDFCAETLNLTLGMRATPLSRDVMEIQSLIPLLENHRPEEEEKTSCTAVFEPVKRALLHETAPFSTTAPFVESAKKYKLRRIGVQNPISPDCTIVSQPSCPLCTDGVIRSNTGASGTLYVWADLPSALTSPVRSDVGVGTYFLAIIEPGQNIVTDGAPKCVITVMDTLEPYIAAVSVSLPFGCFGSTRVNITIDVEADSPSTGIGIWLTYYDAPIVSCSDPRLAFNYPSGVFSAFAYSNYSTAICDGASITEGPLVMTTGPENSQLILTATPGQVCYSDAGIVPVVFPVVRGLGGVPIISPITITPAISPTEITIDGTDFTITFVDYTESGPRSLYISDVHACASIVVISTLNIGVCNSTINELAILGEIDPAPYDCIITNNETVPDAIVEINWCVSNNLPVFGSNAPVIYLPVSLPTVQNPSLEFFQFNASLTIPGQFSYMQNVNLVGATLTVAANVATFSNGVYNCTIYFPGNINLAGNPPNQQVSLQYGAIDGSWLVFGRGSSSLLLYLAHVTVSSVSANLTRNGVRIELISSSVAVFNLYLPNIETSLAFSNDGMSRIALLRVFIAGINATANSTLQVVCYYFLNYPQVITSAQAGNNGTVIVVNDQCINYGIVITPSQSQSVNHNPIYTPQTSVPKSLFLFTYVIVFAVASMLMIFAVRGPERRN